MNKEIIKLSESELGEIASIQEAFRKQVFALGQIEIAIKELTVQKDDLFNQLLDIHKQEETFISKLTTTYGDGSLNLKEGTFKPVKS